MFAKASTKISFVMLTLTIIAITANSVSQAKINHPQLQVKTVVLSDDFHTGVMQSYLHRELRALGDVKINTHTPDWTIIVSHFEREDPRLHTFAVACTRGIPKRLLKPNLDQVDKQWVANTLGILDHVFGVSGGDLDEVCKLIIAQVDTLTFERIRQLAEVFLPITHPTYDK